MGRNNLIREMMPTTQDFQRPVSPPFENVCYWPKVADDKLDSNKFMEAF